MPHDDSLSAPTLSRRRSDRFGFRIRSERSQAQLAAALMVLRDITEHCRIIPGLAERLGWRGKRNYLRSNQRSNTQKSHQPPRYFAVINPAGYLSSELTDLRIELRQGTYWDLQCGRSVLKPQTSSLLRSAVSLLQTRGSETAIGGSTLKTKRPSDGSVAQIGV